VKATGTVPKLGWNGTYSERLLPLFKDNEKSATCSPSQGHKDLKDTYRKNEHRIRTLRQILHGI